MDMLPFQMSGLGATPVYAEKAASGLTVRWQYSGKTPEYFYVQLYRNGSFKGNTEVAANLRAYNYTTENPTPTNKLYFKVYAQVPGSGLVLVGQSPEYSSLVSSAPAPTLPPPVIQTPTTPVQTSQQSDNNLILSTLNEISTTYLDLPLTPAMGQQYLTKFKNYTASGMAPNQAFDRIAAEFEAAVENEDIAFYESRTGDIITGEGFEDDIDPDLLPYVQKTAGASGGNNMLIYAGIAAAGLFLLFGGKKKGKALSGTPRKRKTSVRKARRSKTTKRR